MEQENSFLGCEKVSKLLLKFSIPCILSLLISALYNIVDQIFVGNSELGYLGNAATGIVFPILIIAQAFAWCIGDGSAAYLSLCQGRKDTKSAHKCIGTGITITVIISVILLTVFLIIKEPLLRLFGASDNTIDLAIEYFVIVIPFFPVFMVMNMMNSVIRADGSPAFSMIAMASGAVVNIILDPIFIFACHFGIAGAAWATVIGQIVSFVLTVIYCFRTKTFKFILKSFIPNFKIFKNALLLGISTFITQMSIVVISLVCNIMLAKYGALSKYGPDIPISAISIETKVFTIIINIVVGIVLGGQPIIGYNYGAGKIDRVKKTYQLILLSSLIVGLVSTLIIEIFPDAVIAIFGSANDALYLEFSRKLFRIFLSLVTGTCLIKMTSIFFQAVGQTVKATIVSLTRDIVCFIPLVVCLPLGLGIDGILYAAPIADVVGILVAGILTILFFKGLKHNELKLEKDETKDRL
ncbi:MAG: MATE family efflux transporter [Anaeroplasmataceae bacterium]|nr:MATE family efflux transporter [Anaeroplasmataceae bacterium]